MRVRTSAVVNTDFQNVVPVLTLLPRPPTPLTPEGSGLRLSHGWALAEATDSVLSLTGAGESGLYLGRIATLCVAQGWSLLEKSHVRISSSLLLCCRCVGSWGGAPVDKPTLSNTQMRKQKPKRGAELLVQAGSHNAAEVKPEKPHSPPPVPALSLTAGKPGSETRAVKSPALEPGLARTFFLSSKLKASHTCLQVRSCLSAADECDTARCLVVSLQARDSLLEKLEGLSLSRGDRMARMVLVPNSKPPPLPLQATLSAAD